jgi:hypothetical protein
MELGPGKRTIASRLRVPAFVLLTSIVVLAACVTGLVRNGERREHACMEAAARGEERDPLRCVRDARARTAAFEAWPMVRQLRQRSTTDADPEIAAVSLEVTTAAWPDAVRRAEAARFIVEQFAIADAIEQQPRAVAIDRGALREGIGPGRDPLAALHLFNGMGQALSQGLEREALELGVRIDAARRSEVRGQDRWRCDLPESAQLCLLGKVTEGRALFEASTCCDAWRCHTELESVRQLGGAICGGDVDWAPAQRTLEAGAATMLRGAPDSLLDSLSPPTFGCAWRHPPVGATCTIDPAAHEMLALQWESELAPAADIGPHEARSLRLEAAVEHLHRGHREEAIRLLRLARASASPGPSEWELLGPRIALAARDPRLCLELAIEAEARFVAQSSRGHAPMRRVLALVYQAVALSVLGDARAAEDRARLAHELVDALPVDVEQTEDVGVFGERVRWLHAALAVRAGQGLAPGLRTHPMLDATLALLGQRGSERRRQRMTLAPEPQDRVDVVTPFEMFLVAETARGDGDVEVWLDRIFVRAMRHAPRSAMQARADAASLRGDTRAAQEWQARADALQRLIMDDRTAALARIADL